MNIIAFEAEGGYKLAVSLDKKDLAFTKAIFLPDMKQSLTYDTRNHLELQLDKWDRPCLIPALPTGSFRFLADLIWLASQSPDHQITTKVIKDYKEVIDALQSLRLQARVFREQLSNSLIVTKIKVKMTK